jgi:hypothetical protein
LRCSTRLMGMQWRGARSCNKERVRGRRWSGGGRGAENW